VEAQGPHEIDIAVVEGVDGPALGQLIHREDGGGHRNREDGEP
jgi:hypothetical protein